MKYRICLLAGDGIGPEVVNSAEEVLSALPINWDFVHAPIGYGAYQQHGTPLPDATLKEVRSAHATLLGAVTTPPGIPNYFSPVVRLRQELDLYANIRPCRTLPHPSSAPNIDLTIVRENTEGLYAGVEHIDEQRERAVTERIITRRASEKIIRKAFDVARSEKRTKVTLVHKANILRQTCGLFREVGQEIASDFPDIVFEEMLVDNCAMQLIRAPEQFEVIVTSNLFGDILSDEASMLVGGLGVAYSGNIGENAAVFEPVHGSAPDIVGKDQANPIAALLAAAMMLDYLDEHENAEMLRSAILTCLKGGDVPPDLGGDKTTKEVTESIIALLSV